MCFCNPNIRTPWCSSYACREAEKIQNNLNAKEEQGYLTKSQQYINISGEVFCKHCGIATECKSRVSKYIEDHLYYCCCDTAKKVANLRKKH